MTPTETAAILRQFAQWLRADKCLWGASLPGVSAEVVAAIESAIEMIDRLEATEKDNALKEKLIDRLALELNSASFKRDALSVDRAALQQMLYSIKNRLEATENDSAHHKALAESALRVAKGWEGKCDALRTKIEAMEQQEPIGWLRLYKDGSSSEDFTDLPDVFERQRPLYALPGAKGE